MSNRPALSVVPVRAPRRESKSAPGLSPERTYIWARRLLWLTIGALVLVIVLSLLELPAMWVAPLTAFTGAEMSRRIGAERNPDMPFGWSAILRFSWRVSRGQTQFYEFVGPPRPTPAQRRDQLRLACTNLEFDKKES